MENKKIFILVPDGVGVRNYAYGNFCKVAQSAGYDVTFWNQTPFDLESLGYKEIKITDVKMHPMTYALKSARVHSELNLNIRRTGDDIYDTYRFGFIYKNWKTTMQSTITRILIKFCSTARGVRWLREGIARQERSTDYYRRCRATLEQEKPDLVFCTNHRMVTCIAPMLAAQDLGIPTVTFIFSWDNLPKATKAIETDYYVVWSDYMKNELLYYHNYINEEQVFVTGTPQFEPHTDKSIIIPREDFFTANGLDLDKKYICYSGDDVTTSPNDAQYLADTAEALRQYNAKGHNYGLIFRRCPVDLTSRYNAVIEKYKDIIVPIEPLWRKTGDTWNAIVPTKEDLDLQLNMISHTEMVVNLGSSMVFDYVSFGKPCAFINYDVVPSLKEGWNVKRIYRLVHFRSMPSKEAVVWLNNPEEIAQKIEDVLSGKINPVPEALRWFEVVNRQPASDASRRIVAAFDNIFARNKK